MAKHKAKLAKPSSYAKSIAAGVTTVGGIIVASLLDGHIDGGELTTIIAAGVVAIGAVFNTTNEDIDE